MDDWIKGVCDQVDALVEKDLYYQELTILREELEPMHLEILNSLPQRDRDILVEYEYLISEIAYQRTQAAYQVGKTHRLRVLPKPPKP